MTDPRLPVSDQEYNAATQTRTLEFALAAAHAVLVQPSGGRWGRREVSWWDRIERVVLVVVAFRSAQRLCRCPCVVPRPTVRHSLPLRGRGAAYPLRARRRLASPSTSDRRIDGTTRGRLARTRGSVTRDR